MNNGLFITLEGTDGCGKTTQFQLILKDLEKMNLKENEDYIITREPGGTKVSEIIRKLILDPQFKDEMDEVTEMYLYAAQRSNHVRKQIKPCLEEGKIVLSDRYIDSSLVYQGVARNLGIDKVLETNLLAMDGVLPDITFCLVVSPEIAEQRQQKSNRVKDRIESESKEFFNKIYLAYIELAKMFPDRIVLIDASKSIEEVHEEIIEKLQSVIKEKQNNINKVKTLKK